MDAGLRIRIHMILGSLIRIRIRTRAKRWIRIRIKSQNSGAVEVKMELWDGGRERSQWRRGGSKWSRRGSVDQWPQICTTVMRTRKQGSDSDPDPNQV
jgi:hypothetical protein